MCAADARIILVMQRVIGDVVGANVVPDLCRSPIRERIEFNESEFLIPMHFGRSSAHRRLLAANRRDPCVEAGELLAQRIDLAQVAATVGIAAPESVAMNTLLRFGRERRRASFNANLVAEFDALHQFVCLREEKSGIESEDSKIREDS